MLSSITSNKSYNYCSIYLILNNFLYKSREVGLGISQRLVTSKFKGKRLCYLRILLINSRKWPTITVFETEDIKPINLEHLNH